ncbi:glycoside hydrolase domain-containing protein [Gordonia sp. LUNF6]|uniref:glycoside hydrolase domain-containing protein n=1 Tax=Gordonia sp. LUNF6 TaxID=3388658 RepID=UPI00399BC0C7
MVTVIDTAAGFPSATAIKNAGHTGIIAYVSPSRPGTNFAGKPITRAVADSYRAGGVDIAVVWQLGKPGDPQTPSDWTTGYAGGRRMAKQALANARAAGMPGWCPIYFAVDEDITLDQWNATASQYFKGCCDEIGQAWVGIYGHSRVVEWAVEDGVVDPRRLWVTRAWSDDDGRGYAALYQRVIDTPSNPGPTVGGITVDVNDVYRPDWGQWSIDRTPGAAPTPEPPVTGGVAPRFEAISRIGQASQPRTKTPINWLIHTEQGGGQNPSEDAERLARYCNNTANGVSYHYSLRAGKLVQMVPLDRASWSVLDANAYTVNLCFAGSYAEWTREQWIANCRDDIRIAAYIAVRDCKALGIPTTVIAPPYNRGSGISDHRYVTRALGIGTHTDVGGPMQAPWSGFPWDLFESDIRSFLAPAPNLIDAEAARAAAWIGKRLAPVGAVGETIIRKDGREIGRFVPYENAHIYWRTGATSAFAIPHADPQIPGSGLFETWGADYRYEQGPLGFPKVAHSVVTNGAVQTFEDGQLFRKNGTPRGWRVHGRILDAYAAHGYEQGPLGWPIGDERAVDGTDNREQQFERGRLVWSPTGVTVDLAKGA